MPLPMIVSSCQHCDIHCNVLNSQKLDLFIRALSTATGAKQGGGGGWGSQPPLNLDLIPALKKTARTSC